jgi:hypothetical protein
VIFWSKDMITSIVSNYLIFTIILVGGLATNAFAQKTEAEPVIMPRTFDDCYSDVIASILSLSIAGKTGINVFEMLKIPEMKTVITNTCNFYYEKSGEWLNFNTDFKINEKYTTEFYEKYGHTVPEEFKQFITAVAFLIDEPLVQQFSK